MDYEQVEQPTFLAVCLNETSGYGTKGMCHKKRKPQRKKKEKKTEILYDAERAILS